MVLASWWCLHRLCRFVRSVNRSQSPRCGMIWSTTTALVRMPFAAHSRQNGSRSSCAGRKSCVQVLVLYIQCQVSDTPRALEGLCLGHQPFRVRAAHPGLRQGRSGLFAMADTSQEKIKKPINRNPGMGFGQSALGSKALGSGIFTSISFRQALHL